MEELIKQIEEIISLLGDNNTSYPKKNKDTFIDKLDKINEMFEILQNSGDIRVQTINYKYINKLISLVREHIKNQSDPTMTIERLYQRVNNIKSSIISFTFLENKAKKAEEEIETKRLSINTFAANIEEYKTRIAELEKKANEVIAKDKTVNKLINDAQEALEVNSAQGISAAFAAQYQDIQTRNKFLWIFNSWLVGAAVFALGAIITIWILINQTEDNMDKLLRIHNTITVYTEYWVSMLVARITAVAISLAGATFCAKQYIKQQNIAEDYAYKAVLAKSIVAFTEEIKSHDPSKAGEYLTKVLDEIHKDPLRGRDNKEDSNVGIDLQELIKNLMDKIPTNKQG
ncbi:hypothetical protein SAMN05421780_110149 [Flexibacter flexilis DSM 6793]|uniref:Uncharacterized protein n=2 Tax=Flexibacter flexilis TaxID=998 RepID=A0A1I1MKE7_9BACT|nr:hypothetical protein SAMN05421780_110149 [Flexibacter flexilis DSM 6793]